MVNVYEVHLVVRIEAASEVEAIEEARALINIEGEDYIQVEEIENNDVT